MTIEEGRHTAARPVGTIMRAPLFVQLFALVLVSLIAAQAINIVFVFLLPPPPAEIYALSEIARALKANGQPVHSGNDHTIVSHLKAEPAPFTRGHAGFHESILARSLADEVGVPADRVRVVLLNRWVRRPSPANPLAKFDGRLPPRGSLPPLEERFVLAPFEASVQQSDGRWLSVHMEETGLLRTWQQRVFLCFALSVLLIAPLVFLFARQLARPITAFARAAERLGRNPSSPPVSIDGPSEVRVAAHAFNDMQERLRRYINDRTTMVGAVAHDMRTPLTRIRFRIEAAPEPLRSKLIADIDQMDAMIAATMAFVRDASDPVARRKLELVSLVESVADEMAETGLSVTAEGRGPVVIDGDPVGLRRLVTNLMDNAVKFAGGARARVYAENGSAVLEVDDDGPGVPEHEQEQVFEPFHRGEPSRSRATGGAGLGLAVVRSVARAHGGEASLENRIGGGLRATARLPL